MPEAARLADEIEHTSALAGLLTGLVVGVVVGAVVGACVATGGAAAIVIGAVVGASTGGSLAGMAGEWIGSMLSSPAGPIAEGLKTVLINNRPAARVTDKVACTKDGSMPIATGSETVFIGQLPAARKTDETVCGGKVAAGSPDVIVGGATIEYFKVEGEIPRWARVLEFVIGLPSLITGGVGLLKLGVRALRYTPQLLRGGWSLLKAAPGMFSAAGRTIWGAVSKLPAGIRTGFKAFRDWCPRMCFASATVVSTARGLLPIGEIDPGERVNVFDFAAGQWSSAPVLSRRDNIYSGIVITIYTEQAYVEVTRDHPVWVVSGDTLTARAAAHGLRVGQDEGRSVEGRWINAQDVRTGDALLGHGHPRIVADVRTHMEAAFAVSMLTIAEYENFTVGDDAWLAHNAGWCGALLKHMAKPPYLVNYARINGLNSSLIHAHHIVMKGSFLNWRGANSSINGAKAILKKSGVPLLDDIKDLKSLTDPNKLKNMCWALNQYKGIHSQKYAEAVYKALQKADKLGGPDAVVEALERMAKILERGKKFW